MSQEQSDQTTEAGTVARAKQQSSMRSHAVQSSVGRPMTGITRDAIGNEAFRQIQFWQPSPSQKQVIQD